MGAGHRRLEAVPAGGVARRLQAVGACPYFFLFTARPYFCFSLSA